MEELSLLDKVYNYCARHIKYPSEQAAVAHTLWMVGSYFLEDKEHKDVRVFDNFPLLAFFSVDEDSGKTRALDVTQTLAYNAVDGGTYTASAMLTEIDEQYPTLITLILDESDEVLAPGENKTLYVKLFNNGYQRGKYIVRRHLMEQRNLRTPAYCPKVLGGLTTTLLKKTTRSRTIIVHMRPLKWGERVERHIDKVEGKALSELIMTCRPSIFERLKAVDEDGLSNLSNRAAQIWNPLLAIAKIAGGDE